MSEEADRNVRVQDWQTTHWGLHGKHRKGVEVEHWVSQYEAEERISGQDAKIERLEEEWTAALAVCGYIVRIGVFSPRDLENGALQDELSGLRKAANAVIDTAKK